MNLKKTSFKIATIIIVIGAMSTNTLAVQLQTETLLIKPYGVITPYWENINEISPSISSSGKTLYPEVYIKAKNTSAKITGTLYLEKYSAGKWTRVTSWNISDTGSTLVSKSYKGTSGVKYRTRVIVTVGLEKADAVSKSCII